jgi:hypothetical protein
MSEEQLNEDAGTLLPEAIEPPAAPEEQPAAPAKPSRRGRGAKPAAEPQPAPAAKLSSKTSVAEAAAILGVYESEVVSVDKADEGLVAVTHDGQRYLLTGAAKGDYEWLRVASSVPQILRGE